MLEVGVTPAPTAPTATAASKSISTAPTTTDRKSGDSKAGCVEKSKDTAMNVSKKGDDTKDDFVDEGAKDFMVTFAGRQVAFPQATEEKTNTMTSGEYTAYFALSGPNLSSGDEDDDEFD